MSFELFKLDPVLYSSIKSLNFVTPTPIQSQAIPVVMAGKDVMGLAQTGTGKTAAFALPILHRLLSGARGVVRSLILAPTRELAEQINEAIIKFAESTDLRTVTVYGGVSEVPQIRKVKAGVDIVVACPGRLLDLMDRRLIDMSALEVLVLDEADQMFDMGFLPTIRRILKHLPKNRQTLLFSATMPDEIRGLAQDVLRDPTTVRVNRDVPAETVSHALYPVSAHLKTPLLLQLLSKTDTDSVLVFTRTKHRAKRLGFSLQKAGYKAASLQGNLSQNRRQEALKGFREGAYQILVATDIAARGLDVTGISHVINYDMPSTREAYTHRIGRTGRAAKTGDAFTLMTNEDEQLVRSIERTLGSRIERRQIEGFDYAMSASAVAASEGEPRDSHEHSDRRGSRPTRARPVHREEPAHEESGPIDYKFAESVVTRVSTKAREDRPARSARPESRSSSDDSRSREDRPQGERTFRRPEGDRMERGAGERSSRARPDSREGRPDSGRGERPASRYPDSRRPSFGDRSRSAFSERSSSSRPDSRERRPYSDRSERPASRYPDSRRQSFGDRSRSGSSESSSRGRPDRGDRRTDSGRTERPASRYSDNRRSDSAYGHQANGNRRSFGGDRGNSSRSEGRGQSNRPSRFPRSDRNGSDRQGNSERSGNRFDDRTSARGAACRDPSVSYLEKYEQRNDHSRRPSTRSTGSRGAGRPQSSSRFSRNRPGGGRFSGR